MDRGALWATAHGVTKCWTQLRDYTFTSHFHKLQTIGIKKKNTKLPYMSMTNIH